MLITGSHIEPTFWYDVICKFNVCGFTLTYLLEIGQEQNSVKQSATLKVFQWENKVDQIRSDPRLNLMYSD